MGERAKKLKAEMVLEHIVDLKTQQLYAKRFGKRENKKPSHSDIPQTKTAIP